MTGPIVLDVSRLLSRARRRVPTGIDRVEHAYAEHLHAMVPERLRYAAVHPLGRFCHLPTARTRQFAKRIGAEWDDRMPVEADGRGDAKSLAWRLQTDLIRPRTAPRFLREGGRATYLLASHHHMHQPDTILAARRMLGCAFVCMVHDLIPIEFPEYSRPLEAAKHRKRMETVARFADAVLLPSDATRAALEPFFHAAGRPKVPIVAVPLGVHEGEEDAAAADGEPPYFIYVGTIEPRKNHLLLLQLWRRLALELGERCPRLVLIGQRGWENEMVVDVLERSEVVRPFVSELNAVPDREVRRLMRGARALLMPSFAEGYGLPLAEALAAGVPALCSDIPALRGVGGAAAEFLDPMDGPGWLAAIMDYARPDSARRAAQLARLGAWKRPEWGDHMRTVLGVIDGVSEGAAHG